MSPYGLGFQGAPLTASSPGSLLHRLLSLWPSSPKEREMGWTPGERSRALQSSRCTGLRRLAVVDEKWCKLILRCRAMWSDSSFQYISRKWYHSPIVTCLRSVDLWFFPQGGSYKFCTAEPCHDDMETVGYLKMHRCVCVQPSVVMQLQYLHLCVCSRRY